MRATAELLPMGTITAQLGQRIEVGDGPKGTRLLVDVTSVEVESDRLRASLAAIAYHFPGHGNPIDMTADIKISVWRPSLETYGRDADLYVNGGGRQMDDAIFGEIMSCDSPRMYAATLVRGGQAQ